MRVLMKLKGKRDTPSWFTIRRINRVRREEREKERQRERESQKFRLIYQIPSSGVDPSLNEGGGMINRERMNRSEEIDLGEKKKKNSSKYFNNNR